MIQIQIEILKKIEMLLSDDDVDDFISDLDWLFKNRTSSSKDQKQDYKTRLPKLFNIWSQIKSEER